MSKLDSSSVAAAVVVIFVVVLSGLLVAERCFKLPRQQADLLFIFFYFFLLTILSVNCMLLCPEHNQTSPNITSVIVRVPSLDEMLISYGPGPDMNNNNHQ